MPKLLEQNKQNREKKRQLGYLALTNHKEQSIKGWHYDMDIEKQYEED